MAIYRCFRLWLRNMKAGRQTLQRLISLDEAFAGVDNRNIRDMFRLMAEFQFDFRVNSQVLWETAIHWTLLRFIASIRPENASL